MKVYCRECQYWQPPYGYNSSTPWYEEECSHPKNEEGNYCNRGRQHPSVVNYDNKCKWYEHTTEKKYAITDMRKWMKQTGKIPQER